MTASNASKSSSIDLTRKARLQKALRENLRRRKQTTPAKSKKQSERG